MGWDEKKKEKDWAFPSFSIPGRLASFFVFLWMFFIQQFVREKESKMLFK